jgi:predicted short-subunit dehydrogenase-like oxidoreductase (DUF2520 family)
MLDDRGLPRTFALVGPGRAGTILALALVDSGARCVGVAGRSTDATSTRRVAARLGAPSLRLEDAGRDADLVVVATPDAVIATVAAAVAPALEKGALVIHLSGSSTLHELDGVVLARGDVAVGSLHPLQSLPSETRNDRLRGSWCAVEGPPEVDRLALSLGMHPFRLDPAARAAYHAAACVASNHLVALLGQVERLARAAGAPPEAFLPLVRTTLDNVAALGSVGALTGPVARGDAGTVAAHLGALPEDERATYRALAREALRLSGRRDAALEGALA